MRWKKEFVFLFAVFLLVSFVSGDIHVDKNSSYIQDRVFSGEIISGKINISIEKEHNKLFSSNFEGEMDLLKVLNSSGFIKETDYECDPMNCENKYEIDIIGGGSETKTINPSNEDNYGFKIQSELPLEIKSLKFEIEGNSNAEDSCERPFEIDFFDDETLEYSYNEESENICESKGEDYGCFTDSGGEYETNIDYENMFCNYYENITQAPGYYIGAEIKNNGSSTDESIFMYLFIEDPETKDLEEEAGKCTLTNIPVDGERFYKASCNISKSVQENKNAYVCIYPGGEGEEGSNNFSIKYEDVGATEKKCGGTGVPGNTFTEGIAFQLFYQPLKYKSLSDAFEYNAEEEIIEKFNEYITEQYNNDCIDGCIFPLKFKGQQTFTIKDIELSYSKGSHSFNLEDRKIYSLEKNKPLITFLDYLEIDIGKMEIKSPEKEGERKFELKYGDEEIFDQKVNVTKGFDFSISPVRIYSGRTTQFEIISDEDISSSVWNFGDGSQEETTTGKKISHIQQGFEDSYTVTVTITTDENLISRRSFLIVQGDPKIIANRTIESYLERIKNVKSEIAKMGSFGDKLSSEINMTLKESQVNLLKTELKKLGNNANESDYIEIINRLNDLRIPISIEKTYEADLPLEFNSPEIDPNLVADFSGKQIDNSAEIKSAISSWMENNYDADFKEKKYVAEYNDGFEILGYAYEIKITKKETHAGESSYLFIGVPKQVLQIEDDIVAEEVNSGQGSYIPISSEGKPSTIRFSIISNLEYSRSNIAPYISPELSKLGNFESVEERKMGGFSWVRFLIGLFVVIVIFLILYVILQEWYKRNYEKSLFKDSTDLYNLVNFIYNSRASGLKDNEIRSKLIDKKWRSEQITYAIRKLEGKRTGMWEIPLFKFFENNKVKKEIESRNKKPMVKKFQRNN